MSPAFVTDEIWLVNSTGSHWVESGYIQDNNANINGLGNGQMWFWGDDKPGHVFEGHGVSTSTLPNEQFTIGKNASDNYYVFFGPNIANSTSNTMVPSYGEYGSETTTTASGSSGSWTGVQWYSPATGSWHNGVANEGYLYQQPFTWTTFDTSFKAGNAC